MTIIATTISYGIMDAGTGVGFVLVMLPAVLFLVTLIIIQHARY
jgi:uncharacterized membrane protein YfcA